MCDEDVMQTDNIITYGLLVQKYFQEYSNIFDSKRWEPTYSKNTSKDKPLLKMDPKVAIGSPVNKTVEKFYCKNRHKVKYNKSGLESSTKSVVTCYKCGKKGHLKIGIENPIEMVLMGNCRRYKQEIFKNWSPISLWFQM